MLQRDNVNIHHLNYNLKISFIWTNHKLTYHSKHLREFEELDANEEAT